jgi:hypothetical protein
MAREVQEQAAAARVLVEERERRKIDRIKRQIRQYYATKSEAIKREFEETNALYPFLFSRAWRELKDERVAGVTPPGAEPEALFADVLYPLDTELRELVLEIERIIIGIGQDVARLRAAGPVSEGVAEACGKVVGQARAVLSGRDKVEYNPPRLRALRDSLRTAWRRVHGDKEA